jgi:hypothetical protein
VPLVAPSTQRVTSPAISICDPGYWDAGRTNATSRCYPKNERYVTQRDCVAARRRKTHLTMLYVPSFVC